MRWLREFLGLHETVAPVEPAQFCESCGTRVVWKRVAAGYDPETGGKRYKLAKWCPAISWKHDCD